jgi:hypothetical protein
MKYFNECETIEDVKREFRRLAMIHHPDRGGSTAEMQQINNDYEKAIRSAKTGKKASTDEWIKDQEMQSAYRDIINATINLDGVNVELCGLWLWFTGDTKPHKDVFKSIGCRWARKKKAWYWKPEGLKFRKKSKKELSMQEIRQHYGSQNVRAEKEEREELHAA